MADDTEIGHCCARCGSDVTRIECEHCGGEGVSGHDCGEDSCCCMYPEDNVPCGICGGRGGWLVCLSPEAWCNANPIAGREAIQRGEIEEFEFHRASRPESGGER